MTRYRIDGVLPILLSAGGRAGIWSPARKAGASFIALQPEQILLLVCFMQPSTLEEAFERAGLSPMAGKMLLAPLLSMGYVREHEGEEGDEAADFYRFGPEGSGPPTSFLATPDVLDPAQCRDLAERVMASEMIGDNPLSEGFRGTAGFAITFRRDAIPRVVAWFPELALFLERVIRDDVYRAFHGPKRAAGEAAPGSGPEPEDRDVPRANAFHVNALIIPPGVGTRRHVDVSLGVTAKVVSVLYVQSGGPGDGQLHLFDDGLPVAVINPREGMLVHFRGDLEHGVATRSQDAEDHRISVICEHYVLPPKRLAECPFLALHRRSAGDPSPPGDR